MLRHWGRFVTARTTGTLGRRGSTFTVRGSKCRLLPQKLQIIGPMRDAGQTREAIAAALDRMDVPTSRGGKWTAKQVSRVLDRGRSRS